MANADQPRGASPYGDVIRTTSYKAGSKICPGEFVKRSADGMIDPAASSDAMLGVALEFASASGVYINVADAPDQRFIIQADQSDIDTQTDIGLVYNVLATAENTVYNVARMELDSNTGTASSSLATRPLKLLEVDRRPDNAFGAQVDCIVKINNHQNAGGTGTVGV